MAFVQEGGKDKINFILQFKGAQDPTLQEFIYGILIEKAPRSDCKWRNLDHYGSAGCV